MQKVFKKQQKSFVLEVLDLHRSTDERELRNQVQFSKDALVELLDHPAFECDTFREQFKCLILFLENQNSIYEGISELEINDAIAISKKLVQDSFDDAKSISDGKH